MRVGRLSSLAVAASVLLASATAQSLQNAQATPPDVAAPIFDISANRLLSGPIHSGERPVFRFVVGNLGGGPLEISIEDSSDFTTGSLDTPIDPGEFREVSLTGPASKSGFGRPASVRLRTNDPINSIVALHTETEVTPRLWSDPPFVSFATPFHRTPKEQTEYVISIGAFDKQRPALTSAAILDHLGEVIGELSVEPANLADESAATTSWVLTANNSDIPQVVGNKAFVGALRLVADLSGKNENLFLPMVATNHRDALRLSRSSAGAAPFHVSKSSPLVSTLSSGQSILRDVRSPQVVQSRSWANDTVFLAESGQTAAALALVKRKLPACQGKRRCIANLQGAKGYAHEISHRLARQADGSKKDLVLAAEAYSAGLRAWPGDPLLARNLASLSVQLGDFSEYASLRETLQVGLLESVSLLLQSMHAFASGKPHQGKDYLFDAIGAPDATPPVISSAVQFALKGWKENDSGPEQALLSPAELVRLAERVEATGDASSAATVYRNALSKIHRAPKMKPESRRLALEWFDALVRQDFCVSPRVLHSLPPGNWGSGVVAELRELITIGQTGVSTRPLSFWSSSPFRGFVAAHFLVDQVQAGCVSHEGTEDLLALAAKLAPTVSEQLADSRTKDRFPVLLEIEGLKWLNSPKDAGSLPKLEEILSGLSAQLREMNGDSLVSATGQASAMAALLAEGVAPLAETDPRACPLLLRATHLGLAEGRSIGDEGPTRGELHLLRASCEGPKGEQIQLYLAVRAFIEQDDYPAALWAAHEIETPQLAATLSATLDLLVRVAGDRPLEAEAVQQAIEIDKPLRTQLQFRALADRALDETRSKSDRYRDASRALNSLWKIDRLTALTDVTRSQTLVDLLSEVIVLEDPRAVATFHRTPLSRKSGPYQTWPAPGGSSLMISRGLLVGAEALLASLSKGPVGNSLIYVSLDNVATSVLDLKATGNPDFLRLAPLPERGVQMTLRPQSILLNGDMYAVAAWRSKPRPR